MSDAGELLFRAYLGLRVLRAMMEKAGLRGGDDVTAELIRDIEREHPHFPAKAALR
ncbi:hypothetical protein [Ensifer aridi]|uniref:hypothetical protein n=1 Tax=Ensifer aridi TaxID=1708715 RepID=UPI0015E439B6|nr:hypothetical protein [Ensifer aridi]